MTIAATTRKPAATTAKAQPAAQLFHGQSTAAASEERTPDLVTAIFDVLIETHPELQDIRPDAEPAIRNRLLGLRGTVTDKPDSETMATRVLALFNGRNAREVARKLGIGRASVYRYLKQAGGRVEYPEAMRHAAKD